MSTLAYPPDRPLSVGEVLDLSFRIYRLSVVQCLLFATLGVIAGQLPSFYLLVKGRGNPLTAGGLSGIATLMQGRTWIALYLAGFLVNLVFYGAMQLREHVVSTAGKPGGELPTALRRLPAMLGVMILTGLGTTACVLPAYLTAGVLQGLLAVIAVLVLSYGLVAVSCAFTILLLEGAGPAASLARSWRLATGSFWRLSMIYTVAIIIFLALEMIIGAVGVFVVAVLAHGDVAIVTAFTQVGSLILEALVLPFFGAVALAVLADLKVRKEGADLAQRISATA